MIFEPQLNGDPTPSVTDPTHNFPLGQVTLSESEPVRTSPDLLVLANRLTELGTDRDRHQPNWPFCPSGAKMTPNLSDMTSNIYRDYPGSCGVNLPAVGGGPAVSECGHE